MKNDRGFTLAELIVVIAILGICAGIMTVSISSVSTSRVTRCARSIDSLLSRCRIDAMSRSGANYLEITSDSTGVKGTLYENGAAESTALAPNGVTVSYTAGGATAEIAAGSPLYISFDRSTGALLPVGSLSGGSVVFGAAGTGNRCTAITVSGSGRTVVITLVPATGRHGID